MTIIAIILLVLAFIRTVSYGIYELKKNNNKFGAFFIFALSTIGLIFPTTQIILNYYF